MIRDRSPMYAVAAAVAIVIAALTFVTPPADPGRHEASIVIRGADLRFNADRFSRIAAAVLRDHNQDISAGTVALPIEGTRLIRLTTRATDPDTALGAVEALAEQLLPPLDDSGLGAFDVVGDPQVVRRSRSHPDAQSVAVGVGATVLLSTAGVVLINAWRRTNIGDDAVSRFDP